MESKGSSLNIDLVLILGTSGMLLLATAIILFIYLYQRKLIKRKLAYQKIEDLLKKQELKSTYALIEGQEAERKRIAQDLHDSLGSMLVTLNMYADTLIGKAAKKEVKQLAEKISDITQQATEETRRISHNLDTSMLTHFGLEAAINDLLNAIRKAKSMAIVSHIHLPHRLHKEVSNNLYRIIQELINNTLKHAHATKIHLEVSQISTEYISLIYEDNGVGFDTSTKVNGMGLTNIASRIDTTGGTLQIDSKIKKGSSFIIEIPLYGKN